MEKIVLNQEEIERLASVFRDADPATILRAALEHVPNMTLACSFGAEDMVLLDILMKVDPQASVFYLDTDVLFPETYTLREEAVNRYGGIPGLRRVQSKLTLEKQANDFGEALWERDPNQCCSIRKVEPLSRMLSEVDAWITGIRRDQAPTRANAQVFEADEKFGIVKVNPLAFWTSEQVWAYIRENRVPYNPLHDQGYPSIGCLYCTKPVKEGEDPRSGRWAGFVKTECGLHK